MKRSFWSSVEWTFLLYLALSQAGFENGWKMAFFALSTIPLAHALKLENEKENVIGNADVHPAIVFFAAYVGMMFRDGTTTLQLFAAFSLWAIPLSVALNNKKREAAGKKPVGHLPSYFAMNAAVLAMLAFWK